MAEGKPEWGSREFYRKSKGRAKNKAVQDRQWSWLKKLYDKTIGQEWRRKPPADLQREVERASGGAAAAREQDMEQALRAEGGATPDLRGWGPEGVVPRNISHIYPSQDQSRYGREGISSYGVPEELGGTTVGKAPAPEMGPLAGTEGPPPPEPPDLRGWGPEGVVPRNISHNYPTQNEGFGPQTYGRSGISTYGSPEEPSPEFGPLAGTEGPALPEFGPERGTPLPPPTSIGAYGSPDEAPPAPTMGPLASVQREEEDRQSALERTIGGMDVGKAGRISSGNIVYYRDPKTGTIHGISKGSKKKADRTLKEYKEAPEGFGEALRQPALDAWREAQHGGKEFQQISDFVDAQEGGLEMTPGTLKMLTELKALQAKRRRKGPLV